MTVYNQISKNKWRTFFIILIFIFLISGFFYLIGRFFESPTAYFIFGFIVSLISAIGSYFYSDKIILFTTGAKPANRQQHFDFYTVAENLSIAGGVPAPRLYVIDDPSPNAFATGRNPANAVVAATTGLLALLDRRELEGVVAHELSHVKNYDILLSSIVAVLVGTIALVSDWIIRSMWWSGRKSSDRDEGRNPIVLFLFIIVLIITPIVATLIQLSISRKREFLADASGALLTRYPEGLARALEKISGYPYPMKSVSPSTAHLFISNPLKKIRGGGNWLTNLFSTHPPVDERIRILRSI
jgi:heat shock protein HtpX